MPVVDSIPRKIIAYLRQALPADIDQRLKYDAVAQRNEAEPVCIINAAPSIPDTRTGGRVHTDTRSLVCYATLIWSARDEGKNYDEFEAAAAAIADALAGLQGTDALGSQVLKSSIEPEECATELNIEAMVYVAQIEVKIMFVR